MTRPTLGSMPQQNAVEAYKQLEDFANKLDDKHRVRATKSGGIYGSTSKKFRIGNKESRQTRRQELKNQLELIGKQCFGDNREMKQAWTTAINMFNNQAKLGPNVEFTGKDFRQLVTLLKAGLITSGAHKALSQQQTSASPAKVKPLQVNQPKQHSQATEMQSNKTVAPPSSNVVESFPDAESEDSILSFNSDARSDRSDSSSWEGTEYSVSKTPTPDDYEPYVATDVWMQLTQDLDELDSNFSQHVDTGQLTPKQAFEVRDVLQNARRQLSIGNYEQASTLISNAELQISNYVQFNQLSD